MIFILKYRFNTMSCKTQLTYVYSSPCISFLRELIESLDSTFSVKDKLDDMFWYGIFCNPETYSNFRYYDLCKEEVPGTKLSYIKDTITKIIKGEIDKPEYFFYVEETESFNDFEDAPSTFLYLIPQDEKYRKFGEALTNFLYSPNLMITLKTK